MIEIGWITPDGTEIRCGGDSWIVHELAVIKFIRGLRFQNLELKKKIDEEIEDWRLKYGSYCLYPDYAIERLGWIQVGAGLFHGIEYAGFDWQKNMIFPYKEAGYRVENMYVPHSSYLKIDCNILLAIKNGDKRVQEDGNEFKYDGTDKGDTYVNEMGIIRKARWSDW